MTACISATIREYNLEYMYPRTRTAAAGTKERESAYGLRGAHTFYFYFARWITREEQDSEPAEFLVPTDW